MFDMNFLNFKILSTSPPKTKFSKFTRIIWKLRNLFETEQSYFFFTDVNTVYRYFDYFTLGFNFIKSFSFSSSWGLNHLLGEIAL